MTDVVLVTGAAGGSQGSTGNRIVHLLIQRGLAVRAFVHRLDERSDRLRELGADVVQGDQHQTRYPLVGDTPIVSELTETFSAALGRPVRYVDISASTEKHSPSSGRMPAWPICSIASSTPTASACTPSRRGLDR